MPQSNVARGVIRNREYATQIRDFSGLRWNNVTPTDIDGFVEFWDKIFIVIEAKHGCSTPPQGQLLALERLTDALESAGKLSYCLLCSHNTSGDIDYASLPVTRYRFRKDWHTPTAGISAACMIDFIRRSWHYPLDDDGLEKGVFMP